MLWFFIHPALLRLWSNWTRYGFLFIPSIRLQAEDTGLAHLSRRVLYPGMGISPFLTFGLSDCYESVITSIQ